MRKGRLMTCPGIVDLVVHPPMPTVGLSRSDVRELATRCRELIAHTVDTRSPGVDRLNGASTADQSSLVEGVGERP